MEPASLEGSEAFRLKIDLTLRGPLDGPHVGIGIGDAEGRRIATILSETALPLPEVPPGGSVDVTIISEPVRFSPGILYLKVELANRGRSLEVHEGEIELVIPDYRPFRRPPHTRPRGVLLITHDIITR